MRIVEGTPGGIHCGDVLHAMGAHFSGVRTMKYLLAIIFPPAALLMCGKPFQCILNLVLFIISVPLTLMFGIGFFIWLLCVAHAFIACVEHDRERHERLAHAIESPSSVMEHGTPPLRPAA
jgi:hypothetical protein